MAIAGESLPKGLVVGHRDRVGHGMRDTTMKSRRPAHALLSWASVEIAAVVDPSSAIKRIPVEFRDYG
jgi:hypothetical protein